MSGRGCSPMSPPRLVSAEAFDAAVGGGRRRRSAHAPGRVLADLAVMLADGGVAIGDLAVLRDQPRPVRAGGLHGDGVAGPRLGQTNRCWIR